MQKDATRVKENLPSEKRLFLHADHGRAQSISMRMKLFLIKKHHCTMNVTVTPVDPEKIKKSLDYCLLCFNSFNPSSTAIFRHRLTDWLIVG